VRRLRVRWLRVRRRRLWRRMRLGWRVRLRLHVRLRTV